MNFLSVCSGIEAASVAWRPLGWRALGVSEIDPFARSVLAHHYPDTPNHGDMTRYRDWPDATPDVLCAGTPCPSFSVAGRRFGMVDPRGDLALAFADVASRYRPRWIFWENVPGVLSSNSGRDFGALVGLLGQRGYGLAYRVFDAQFFGLAQRRRRVFLVGCLGDWRASAAVLFEPPSVSGNAAPRRELTRTAAGAGRSVAAFGGNNTRGPIDIATAVRAKGGSGHNDFKSETFIVSGDTVRRLTPREFERLQGLPDDYTLVRHRGRMATDGPRYRVVGNSWPVPVVRWIGRRIEAVDGIRARAAA